MLNLDIRLENTWKQQLTEEFDKPYFSALMQFLAQEKENGKTIFPKENNIFNAYNSTPFNKVKVVIIGQDPYHGTNQAHGLSFSVQNGIKPPPSLVNIYKEIKNNYPNFKIPNHGNLETWAKQGVLLLNSILTVEKNKPASHQKKGWEHFTDASISKLSQNREGIIFILWGNFAQQKASLIDENRHHILKAAHPSPFSAHNGFFGCNHFEKVNQILRQQGKSEINWQLPVEPNLFG